MTEAFGDPIPVGVQHRPARVDWKADTVRDDLMGYMAEHLDVPGGVRVAGETGFLKMGAESCGLARQ